MFIEQLKALDSITNVKRQVSKTDYDSFCKEFVFLKLKDISFGKAFCDKFEFNDIFLSRLSDEFAKDQIEKLGYIK